MTSLVKKCKKQDTYDQMVKRNRILTRKLRDTTEYFSRRVANLESELDRYKKHLEHLTSVLDRTI